MEIIKKGIQTLFVLFALFIMESGCRKNDNSNVNRITTPADFEGFITRTDMGSSNSVIYAESHADKLVSRYVIEVTGNTLYFRQDGEKFTPVSAGELTTTDQVKVWFAKPVKGDRPKRGTAEQVVIVTFTGNDH